LPDALALTLSLLPEGHSSSSLQVQAANAPQFRSLILPEWYDLVRDRKESFSSVRSLRGPGEDDQDWIGRSTQNRQLATADEVQSLDVASITRGFVAGPYSEIRTLDAPQLGKMILWNVAGRAMVHTFMRADFSLEVFREQRLEREVEASLLRLIPGRLGEALTSKQILREVFAVIRPDPFSGYRFLTFRFLGEEEDLLWLYSPLLTQVRQLAASNRSDEIFRLGTSLDDLFLWSEKVELDNPKKVDELTALVPFFDAERQDLSIAGDACVSAKNVRFERGAQRFGSGSEALLLGASDAHFSEEVRFVPRPLARIQISPQDSFSAHGRSILYVDQALQIPVARVVFDRAGHPWKLLMGAVAIPEQKETGRREPYIREMHMRDLKSGARTVLSVNSVSWCTTLPEDVPRAWFDPSQLKNVQ
jgi:hypothetical protein